MKLIWTRTALENLKEIEGYIARDNPKKAIEFTDRLIGKCENLKDNPDMECVVPEFQIQQVRELIVKNYRIVYRHVAEEIQILTVFEGHRLLPLD